MPAKGKSNQKWMTCPACSFKWLDKYGFDECPHCFCQISREVASQRQSWSRYWQKDASPAEVVQRWNNTLRQSVHTPWPHVAPRPMLSQYSRPLKHEPLMNLKPPDAVESTWPVPSPRKVLRTSAMATYEKPAMQARSAPPPQSPAASIWEAYSPAVMSSAQKAARLVMSKGTATNSTAVAAVAPPPAASTPTDEPSFASRLAASAHSLAATESSTGLWTTHTLADGRTYYHNRETDETTWIPPRALLSTQQKDLLAATSKEVAIAGKGGVVPRASSAEAPESVTDLTNRSDSEVEEARLEAAAAKAEAAAAKAEVLSLKQQLDQLTASSARMEEQVQALLAVAGAGFKGNKQVVDVC